MEISPVPGHRLPSIFFTVSPPPPLPFSTRPITNFQSPSTNSVTTTTNNTRTLRIQSQDRPSKEYISISHQDRQSAILDIQQSNDLQLALSRSGDMLKVQDFNVVMRQFGKQNRFKDLSQV
ncbi:hypothetical protein L1987_49064 [Smallanthus sonchifolius]|uniref:Uncharacterized protein n=1 Tax=Smallanthus sonchifolius TaxID=185202 RepID=A0ACB9FUS2_9ASTR|nr:hypothetical protein L1987_49064 [Smallanthus sonchifolius]